MAHAIASHPTDWPLDALLEAKRFRTLNPFLRELKADTFPGLDALNALTSRFGVRNAAGLPLRFMSPQTGQPYEVAIHEMGHVPTREGSWHDLFNALAWCAFPATKALLNELHVRELATQGEDTRRSAVRDVLTAFDESGMVVASAEPKLAELLREFQWKELFWRRRAQLLDALSFFVFGHAIHEQMLRPYDGITAKAVIVEVDQAFFDCERTEQLRRLDEALYGFFSRAENLRRARDLQPVPVLGIPRWWPANEAEAYYDNSAYFRPRRSK